MDALDFFAERRYLVIDVVVTTCYRNTIVKGDASVPDLAPKHAEVRKFYAGRVSTQPIVAIHGGPRVMVPFVMEDGGHLGAHALALLRALAIISLDKDSRPPFAYRASRISSPPLLA